MIELSKYIFMSRHGIINPFPTVKLYYSALPAEQHTPVLPDGKASCTWSVTVAWRRNHVKLRYAII